MKKAEAGRSRRKQVMGEPEKEYYYSYPQVCGQLAENVQNFVSL